MSKDPNAILDLLQKPKGSYEFKGVGSTEYYLGGDVKITYRGDSFAGMGLSSKAYVKQTCNTIEMLMAWKLKGMMVRSLNWLVTLGLYDIHYTQNYKFSINYDIKEPDFLIHKIEEYDWFPLYGNTKEEELYGMREPK
eukprot:11837431-Ditylum_brightwellii.AAC.1